MMIIAHRANLRGVDKSRENKPEAILECLDLGFFVEVDLWVEDHTCWLGHDGPETRVQKYLVKNSKGVIYHCKNAEALEFCNDYSVEHYFSHDKDDVVLTSLNFFWTYPKPQRLSKRSIPVVLNKEVDFWTLGELDYCSGICTDEPIYFRDLFLRGVK